MTAANELQGSIRRLAPSLAFSPAVAQNAGEKTRLGTSVGSSVGGKSGGIKYRLSEARQSKLLPVKRPYRRRNVSKHHDSVNRSRLASRVLPDSADLLIGIESIDRAAYVAKRLLVTNAPDQLTSRGKDTRFGLCDVAHDEDYAACSRQN